MQGAVPVTETESVTVAVTNTVTATVTVTATATAVSLSMSHQRIFSQHGTHPEEREPIFMLTIETDQGPFLLKVTPTTAHFRSGTAVGRCWGALEGCECKSIEIHTVLQNIREGCAHCRRPRKQKTIMETPHSKFHEEFFASVTPKIENARHT